MLTSNACALTMDKNFLCLNFSKLRESRTKHLVLNVPNKTVLLNINTNTFLMFQDPYFSNITFLLISGICPLLMQFTYQSITFPPLSPIIIPIFYYIINILTTPYSMFWMPYLCLTLTNCQCKFDSHFISYVFLRYREGYFL